MAAHRMRGYAVRKRSRNDSDLLNQCEFELVQGDNLLRSGLKTIRRGHKLIRAFGIPTLSMQLGFRSLSIRQAVFVCGRFHRRRHIGGLVLRSRVDDEEILRSWPEVRDYTRHRASQHGRFTC